MTISAKGDTERQQVNGHMNSVAGRSEDGNLGHVACKGKEREYRINRTEEDVKDGCEEALQIPKQKQCQGSVALWERFLHLRSIKVLLVENDDSTRHVVAALLRNLNYEVIVAANGLQAWKILVDLTNHIDIVLTEVVMPCLSGVGLLCKIMSHRTRKNIPVIMMSSHDSMGLVFKCLSKGAVDFLGKPIRKNELKNLWQHVWRRCHSSSGSGSESGTQTVKSIKSKIGAKSDDNINSSNEDDNETTDLNIGDASDDSSGTQSSWAKEVDSSQAMSSWNDQMAKSSDSTCAQLHVNAEIYNGKLVPVGASKEFQEREEKIDNVRKGKELAVGNSNNSKLEVVHPNEVPFKHLDSSKDTLPKLEPSPKSTRRSMDLSKQEDHYNKDKAVVARITSPQVANSKYGTLSERENISESKNKAVDDSKGEPEVDFSLKRSRAANVIRKDVQVDRNVLRRSDFSAFSRCNSPSNGLTFKVPNGISRSSSPINSSPEIVKDESGDGNLLYPNSKGINHSVNMGSVNDKVSVSSATVWRDKLVTSDKLESTSEINDLNISSVVTPDLNLPPQQVILVETDDLVPTAMRASQQELPIQHIHHHHHVHHFHSMDTQQPLSNFDDLSYQKLTEDEHFGFVGPVEGNTGNQSLNKSGSGSNHGSNGQNGSSTIVHAGGMNVENDVGGAEKGGSGDISGNGRGNRIDQNKSAHREAALTKFRQKKKVRRFIKVKNQNRKRPPE